MAARFRRLTREGTRSFRVRFLRRRAMRACFDAPATSPLSGRLCELRSFRCRSGIWSPRRWRPCAPCSLWRPAAAVEPVEQELRLGFLVNELPFVLFYCLLASTLLALGQRDLDSPVGWVAFGVAVVTTLGLALVAWRGLQAGPALDRALSEGLGSGWRKAVDPGLAARLRRRLPLGRILFAPFVMRRRDVIRVADISYGDAGRRNLLDVYHQRRRPSGGPVLVYVHGGSFRSGRKNREARPLLYRLASQGWVCISANYRLSPAATFPDHLIGIRR